MADWLTNNWGNLASAVGLFVSIIGFSVAVAQIMRSRRAAEAAEQAVLETKESLTKNLTIADLTSVSGRIQEIRRLLRQAEWEQALDVSYTLRVMLSDIKSRHPSLTQNERRAVQRAIDQLSGIEVKVAESLTSNSSLSNMERSEAALIRIQTMLHELSSNLKQSL